MTNYTDRHRSSIEHPEEFWAEAAEGIDWEKPWDKVLEKTDSMTYRWFPGAELNTCFNAVDRHVMRGRAEQTAIIYDSPVTSTQRKNQLCGAAGRSFTVRRRPGGKRRR